MAAIKGFVLAYCGDRCCPPAITTELKAAVRHCPQGILLRTGCVRGLTGAGGCQPVAEDTATGPGPCVLVQPGDAEQQPIGPAFLAGPLHEPADLRDLRGWLSNGLLAGEPLPPHLRLTFARDAT